LNYLQQSTSSVSAPPPEYEHQYTTLSLFVSTAQLSTSDRTSVLKV